MAKIKFQLWSEKINISNGNFILGIFASLMCGFVIGVMSQ